MYDICGVSQTTARELIEIDRDLREMQLLLPTVAQQIVK